MIKKINFKNPYNTRKWLNLLKADSLYGITFHPNLNIRSSHLGFSFKSNTYGLRGSGNDKSNTVICGTSYAMGLSVNNGENWYERSSILQSMFNIGMPVSPKNHLSLLHDFYNGNFKHLIYIYHPNIWILALQYEQASKNNISIFDYLKWETSYFKTTKLYIKWKVTNLEKKISGNELYYVFNNTKYQFQSNYSYFDLDKNILFLNSQIRLLNSLFRKFSKVTIVRVPIKEQLAIHHIYSPELKNLSINFDNLWNYFIKNIDRKNNLISLLNYFKLDDYLPNDTHWSPKGNQHFSNYMIKNKIY